MFCVLPAPAIFKITAVNICPAIKYCKYRPGHTTGIPVSPHYHQLINFLLRPLVGKKELTELSQISDGENVEIKLTGFKNLINTEMLSQSQ